MTVNVIPVTGDRGEVTNADMLVAAEGVHRQLRPGTQRQQAHKFSFREGLPITSFHFSKKL